MSLTRAQLGVVDGGHGRRALPRRPVDRGSSGGGERWHGADDVRLAPRRVRRRPGRDGVRQAVHGVSVDAGARLVTDGLHVRPRPRSGDAPRWRDHARARARRRAPPRATPA